MARLQIIRISNFELSGALLTMPHPTATSCERYSYTPISFALYIAS
jgi:hypothetical protein